jgi:HEAT repeat protein
VTLSSQVMRFRTWAAEQRAAGRALGGEWECNYPDWARLHRAVEELLRTRACSTWTAAERRDLLYVLARDNEIEHVARLVVDGLPPDDLLALVETAIADGEGDARWQLAERLPELAALEPARVEQLLVRLAGDPEEYVRRRALGALGRIGSAHAERLALAAWDEDHDSQQWTRMNVLAVLAVIDSPHHERLRAEAENDPREHLSAFARTQRLGEEA